MDTIVVTGGAGFIGSHLVDHLLKQNYQVVVLDDLSGGYQKQVASSARFIKVDLRKFAQLKKIMATIKPTIIFHLAANAAENKAQYSPIDISSRNYDAALKVLVASIPHGLKRFIFTSSIAVYGQAQTPFLETTLPVPEDIYGISKLAFEQSLKVLSEVHGFEHVIVRPHNVYGPRQNMSDPYRNVVTLFMNQSLHQQPFYIYGDGQQKRCFSYVDDVVTALAKCTTLPVAGMVFNLGSDKSYTINQLAKKIQNLSGVFIEPVYLPSRAREVKMAISNHRLSKKHLEYEDLTTLEDGLAKTWQWAKKNGPQKLKYTKIEIENSSFPSNWKPQPKK